MDIWPLRHPKRSVRPLGSDISIGRSSKVPALRFLKEAGHVLCKLSGAGTRLLNGTLELTSHTALILDSSCSGVHLSHLAITGANPVHASIP